MKICGAKTRGKKPCQNSPMANGRCRMHGGLSTGNPKAKGNQNAKKHGIYSKYFTDDEKAVCNDLDLSQIDDELRLCKIRLMRALEAEKDQQERQSDGEETALDLVSKTVEPPIIGGIPLVSEDDDDEVSDIVKKVYQRKDYQSIIDRLLSRIQSLTTLRQQLLSQAIDLEIKQIELEKKRKGDDGQTVNVKVGLDYFYGEYGTKANTDP